MFLHFKMKNSWMCNLSRLDPSSWLEVHRFIDTTKRYACREKAKYIYCLCIGCKNIVVFDDTQHIISHLVCLGFMKGYLTWAKHGESSSVPYAIGNPANTDVEGLYALRHVICMQRDQI